MDIESVQGPRMTMELSFSSVVETGALVIVLLSRVFIKSENWKKASYLAFLKNSLIIVRY